MLHSHWPRISIIGRILVTSYKDCRLLTSSQRFLSDSKSEKSASKTEFNTSMLEHLVCPLSKTPLRYEKSTNELICDELGVAYKIINGVPNLIPADARKIDSSDSKL